MFHLKPSTSKWIKQLVILGLLGLVFSAMAGWLFTNSSYFTREGYFVEQPIAFPHELHTNQLGLQCTFCHTQVTKDDHAGMPSMETCYGCHREILKNTDFLKPVRESYKTGKALPWTRVNKLPDHVFFHHKKHIEAGVACESCHGNVTQMPMMTKQQDFTMQFCLDCHRSQPGPASQLLQDCYTCHR